MSQDVIRATQSSPVIDAEAVRGLFHEWLAALGRDVSAMKATQARLRSEHGFWLTLGTRTDGGGH